MAQVIPTWGSRIRGIFQHSISEPLPAFFRRGASNLATDCAKQIRVSDVMMNMVHAAEDAYLVPRIV